MLGEVEELRGICDKVNALANWPKQAAALVGILDSWCRRRGLGRGVESDGADGCAVEVVHGGGDDGRSAGPIDAECAEVVLAVIFADSVAINFLGIAAAALSESAGGDLGEWVANGV